jgi:hypothetical protein
LSYSLTQSPLLKRSAGFHLSILPWESS